MNHENKALQIILGSIEPQQANLFVDGQLLATGIATLDTSGRLLVFSPNDRTLLNTVYPQATMRVVDIGEKSISVTNLRQCSASQNHWHMEVVV